MYIATILVSFHNSGCYSSLLFDFTIKAHIISGQQMHKMKTTQSEKLHLTMAELCFITAVLAVLFTVLTGNFIVLFKFVLFIDSYGTWDFGMTFKGNS